MNIILINQWVMVPAGTGEQQDFVAWWEMSGCGMVRLAPAE
jgi:hypothetical protein